MKKVLLGLAFASAFNFGMVFAKNETLVSIDSLMLMQESAEGKVLTEDIKSKVQKFQDYAKESNEKISKLEKEIEDQKEVLSEKALAEKTETLAQLKNAESKTLSLREQSLRQEIQKTQMQLHDKQRKVADRLMSEQNWGMIIDKNTPGVLCVSKAIDKTSDVLKALDAEYSKNETTKSVAQAPAKKEKATVKTA
ncbi:OmpH family outer membrane protein [Candidatus Babeliales bacterium]|nr:OmpH family outer membrane protein [Candidatus Babeliales bacterium]MBY0352981.1 OmpH family outer membrane protein [Candidatus Babeliales bacterium]